MSHDDARICDVLTSVRDSMVSQLVAEDLGETEAAATCAQRVDSTVRAWLTNNDLIRAVQLLLADEAQQIATRIGTGIALVTPAQRLRICDVTPQTGTADPALRTAVNDTRGAGSHLPGACSATPGAVPASPGSVPHHDEKGE